MNKYRIYLKGGKTIEIEVDFDLIGLCAETIVRNAGKPNWHDTEALTLSRVLVFFSQIAAVEKLTNADPDDPAWNLELLGQ